MKIELQDLPRYYRTPGGVTDGLIAFYEIAGGPDKIGVEVGCAKGESGEIASHFLKTLYCVDAWGPGFDGNEPEFDTRMASKPNVTKVKKPSQEACHDFADESLDVVYIDGMHDYDNVRADILCWFPKVKMGGFIGGHDYDFIIDGHEGVIRVVTELFGEPTWRFADCSFLFCKTPELVSHLNCAIGQ